MKHLETPRAVCDCMAALVHGDLAATSADGPTAFASVGDDAKDIDPADLVRLPSGPDVLVSCC